MALSEETESNGENKPAPKDREAHFYSTDLAERIDMSVTYISYIETAKKRTSLEALVRIANVLGVTVDYFLYGNQLNDSAEYRTDLARLTEDCTSYEKRIIYEIAFAAKKSLLDNKWLQNKDDQL